VTDHPLSKPPMRRSHARPPAPPASSCARCFRPGHIAQDQHSHAGAAYTPNHRLAGIRFDCECGNAWTTDRQQAEAHGRFLQRIHHTHQRGDV
jgi:hypothetical protein